MMNVLTADKLVKSYNNGRIITQVLQSVSLSINEGEIVAINGPSGSGKSTLLNILGLLDDYDSGSLIFQKINVLKKTNNKSVIRQSKIGFIFQFHHLLPEFTVMENLIIPQMLNNLNEIEKLKNANKYLDMLGINSQKNRYPSQISGGERQRVAVVRSVINNPDIVLADEPTGNLDYENGQKVLQLILELSKNNKMAFIIATHDDNISKIADRILYLNNGKLSQKKKVSQ